MESWTKQDWVNYIEAELAKGRFVYRAFFPNKAPFLFACDMFRRRGHAVDLFFDVVEFGPPCTGVIISQTQENTDITVRRDSTMEDILQRMQGFRKVCVRGCGTTVEMVSNVVHFAIVHGWYVDHTEMGTLVKMVDGCKQRNTTLLVILCRGSPRIPVLA